MKIKKYEDLIKIFEIKALPLRDAAIETIKKFRSCKNEKCPLWSKAGGVFCATGCYDIIKWLKYFWSITEEELK